MSTQRQWNDPDAVQLLGVHTQTNATPKSPTDKKSVASRDHVQVEQKKPLHPGTWRWEILNAIFSILCVVVIFIILSRIDGRLLSSWTAPISPNAVISVLSTASKASMIMAVAESLSQFKWLHYEKSQSVEHLQIFDNASRGPWGSFVFFWYARRVSLFAYIGCVVMVAAIALDPFAQQIISYNSRATVVTGVQSLVTRSQEYDNGGKGLTNVYMNMPSLVSSNIRDGPLQAAAISGLYDLTSPPPFGCPGSNCTYPSFTSLGVCSECRDVTNQTTKTCDQTEVSQTCNYTTPNGLELQAYASGDDYYGFRYTYINTTYSTANVLCSDNVPSCLSEPDNSDWADYVMLLNLTILRFDSGYEVEDDWDIHNTSWQNTLQAVQCVHQLCALGYSDWTSVNGTVSPGPLRRSALNGTMSGNLPDEVLVVYTTLDTGFPGNQTFVVNLYDRLNFAQVLDQVTSNPNPSYSPDPKQDNLFLDVLYSSPDLNATMNNISTGMSYRMLSGPQAVDVYGDVYAEQTYIHVRWAWLSLTVILVVVAALFLAAVIFATHKTRQPVWKSLLVPLLYADSRFRDTT